MANIGSLTMIVRAETGQLGKDLAGAQKKVKTFSKSAASTPILAEVVQPPTLPQNAKWARGFRLISDEARQGERRVSGFGRALTKVFRGVGAGPLGKAGALAGDIGGLGSAMGGIGAAGGLAAAGVALVVAGFVALQRAASSAMTAVDNAFNLGERSKTIEALNKIISAGRGAGINITLADAQAVQAVNQKFTELGNAFTALGVQIVSDFQPAIIGAIKTLSQAVQLMSAAAKAIAPVAEKAATTLGSGPQRFAFGLLGGTILGNMNAEYAKGAKEFTPFGGTDSPAAAMARPAALSAFTAEQYSASLAARATPTKDQALEEARRQTEEQRRTNEHLRDLKSWFPANFEVAGI